MQKAKFYQVLSFKSYFFQKNPQTHTFSLIFARPCFYIMNDLIIFDLCAVFLNGFGDDLVEDAHQIRSGTSRQFSVNELSL